MGSDESHFNVSEGSDGQSHKTVSTNHNLSEERGEPKRNRTEVLPLTSLTPYRRAKPAHITSTETIRRRGDQDGHLDFHTAPELWMTNFCSVLFTSTGTVRTIRDGGPRTATSTLAQFLSSEHTPGRNKGLLNRTKSKIAPLTAFLFSKR